MKKRYYESASWIFKWLVPLLNSMGQSWSWSYGSWIYKYLCNQCLSPL